MISHNKLIIKLMLIWTVDSISENIEWMFGFGMFTYRLIKYNFLGQIMWYYTCSQIFFTYILLCNMILYDSGLTICT